MLADAKYVPVPAFQNCRILLKAGIGVKSCGMCHCISFLTDLWNIWKC